MQTSTPTRPNAVSPHRDLSLTRDAACLQLDREINALFREKELWEKAHGRGTWPMEKLYHLRDLTRARLG